MNGESKLWGVSSAGKLEGRFVDCGSSIENIMGIKIIVTLNSDAELYKDTDGVWHISE